ncbi:MAG TPA: cysteine peptidase family C39 domain-containing protein [Planctomycetota bacterium]|nr:cysteine peptidase family C39 domain-containing protein [Planctomycetota bacterium]
MTGVILKALRRLGLTALGAVFLVLAGCGYLGEAKDFDPAELASEPGWIAVSGVPVELQKRAEDCGTAALSMVFEYWRIPLEGVKSDALLVPGKGTAARDLRDLGRKNGLESYLIHGEWSDLRNEVSRGHPVIVGLLKLGRSGLVTHYEVVVAIHPDRDLVVTHDPACGWRQNSRSGFQKEWDPAGYLTLVFYPPPRQASSSEQGDPVTVPEQSEGRQP